MGRLLASSLIAAMVVGCGGAADPGAAKSASTTTTLTITSPKAGETVAAGDVTVTYEISNATLVPAASAKKREDYHVHLLLNVDASNFIGTDIPVPIGDQNPDPTRIIHTAAKTVTFKDVGPGEQTLTVLLAFSDHTSLKPAVVATVKFATR